MVANHADVSAHTEWSIDGVPYLGWLDMFLQSHHFLEGMPQQVCWPDGGNYLEQDNRSVMVFKIIKDAFIEHRQQEVKRARMNAKSKRSSRRR